MSSVYIVTYLCDPKKDWPYDLGDDPSFENSATFRKGGGVLTWGVCRQDVRNNVKAGDLVIFFAAGEHTKHSTTLYRFVGFAMVDQKVKQTDIWDGEKPELAVYKQYGNLLIRPANHGYKHFESGVKWHDDWLWRLVNHKGYQKKDLKALQAKDHFRAGTRIHGKPIEFAANYVLFQPEGHGTFIIANPPVIAEAHQAGRVETWYSDPTSRSVFKEILHRARRHSLRTRNKQQPHRHIKVPHADITDWLERLYLLCGQKHLTMRP